jgi:hypothetical protein
LSWFGSRSHRESALPAPGRVAEVLRDDLSDLPFSIGGAVTPLILPARAYDELFEASHRLLRLLRHAALEVSDTRAGRLAAHGVTEEDWPLFLDDDTLELRYCTCIARPDVVVGAAGPRFLECNVSGVVGGVTETHVLSHSWRRAYGGTFAGLPLDGADPLVMRAELFESICADLGRPPAVAVVAAVHTLWPDKPGTRYLDIEIDLLRRRGLRAELFEPERLLAGLGLPGRPRFPIGLRYLTVQECREHGVSLEPLRAALDAGCVLLAPQSSYFVADKKVFAWLSEGKPWMSASERRFVERYVPWTRVVEDTATTWRGRRCPLIDLLLRDREQFVLKAAFGMQGQGMAIGRDCSNTEWNDAVARALTGGDMIAQELVEAASCDVDFLDAPDGEIETRAVRPVLSPLLIGHRSAGCYVRYAPRPDIRIVSATQHGAIKNVAFRGA